MSEDDIGIMFQRVNYSNSGAIEYSEFVVASLFEQNMIDDVKLQRAFAHFDQDVSAYLVCLFLCVFHWYERCCSLILPPPTILLSQDKGHITNEDLKVALDLGDDMDDYVTNKIIREVDENGDGVICFNEFRDMMFSNAVIPPPPRRSSRRESKSKLDEDGNIIVEARLPSRKLNRSGESGSIVTLKMALEKEVDSDDDSETMHRIFGDGEDDAKTALSILTHKVTEKQAMEKKLLDLQQEAEDEDDPKKRKKKKGLSVLLKK